MTTSFTYTDFANGLWDPTANTLGRVDALTDVLKLLAIDGTLYTPDADADVSLDDIPTGAIIATSATLTGVAVTARGLTFNPATFSAPPAGADITAIVLYQHTGTPSTSALMVFTDDDAAGLPATPDGVQNVQVNPGAGGIAIL